MSSARGYNEQTADGSQSYVSSQHSNDEKVTPSSPTGPQNRSIAGFQSITSISLDLSSPARIRLRRLSAAFPPPPLAPHSPQRLTPNVTLLSPSTESEHSQSPTISPRAQTRTATARRLSHLLNLSQEMQNTRSPPKQGEEKKEVAETIVENNEGLTTTLGMTATTEYLASESGVEVQLGSDPQEVEEFDKAFSERHCDEKNRAGIVVEANPRHVRWRRRVSSIVRLANGGLFSSCCSRRAARNLAIIRCTILFIALILVCVGAASEWFFLDLSASGGFGGADRCGYYLYGFRYTGGELTQYKDGGYCKQVQSTLGVAFWVAILSCVVVGAAWVCAVLEFYYANTKGKGVVAAATVGISSRRVSLTAGSADPFSSARREENEATSSTLTFPKRGRKIHLLLSVFLSFFAFGATSAAWAVGVGFYFSRYCGFNFTVKEGGLEIAAGLSMFIAAWALVLISCAILALTILRSRCVRSFPVVEQ